MDAKTVRNLAMLVNLLSGLLLIGILPQFGISLSQQVVGAINVGVVLGGLELLVAWAIWKKKF